jgi:hypothetical protein
VSKNIKELLEYHDLRVIGFESRMSELLTKYTINIHFHDLSMFTGNIFTILSEELPGYVGGEYLPKHNQVIVFVYDSEDADELEAVTKVIQMVVGLL